MFNSLNSTGMPLSDADIISAHLFSHAPNRTDFKEIWEPIIRQADELSQKKIVNIDSVLQQFMYINRSKEHQYEEGQLNTPGVRKYYTVLYPSLLENPVELCDANGNCIECFGDRKWCSGQPEGFWNPEYGAYTYGGADNATYTSYQRGSCFAWNLEKPDCPDGQTAILQDNEWVCAEAVGSTTGSRESSIRRTSGSLRGGIIR